MTAEIIDGKAAAARLRARVADGAAALKAETGAVPGLAVVLVGDDPASQVYVRSKHRATVAAGMLSLEHRLPADTPEPALLSLIAQLNADPQVHGVLVQLPLPDQIDQARVIDAIDPAKDVDGFHVRNVGRLGAGLGAMVPCTPLGCLTLLRERLGALAGAEAVVLGRSTIVGRPMAQLLLRDSATVTIAHSRTRDPAAICRRADIVIAAVGRPRLVGAEWIRPGATVIDVGINRVAAPDGGTRLVGDCDFEACAAVAGAITPVPGGVGPMTIACLLANTLTACRSSLGLSAPEGLTA